MNRREFLENAGSTIAFMALGEVAFGASNRKKDKRPNILFIMTDQQHVGMMSCTGNKWLKTPAMDSLAATGIRFERAYCSNPVCVPSRFSMLTGHMPSEIGLKANGKAKVSREILEHGMGNVFKRAGYDVAYGGKVHLPMDVKGIGFQPFTLDERSSLADECVKFLEARGESDRPFLLVASFINPHDICYMAIKDLTLGGKTLAGKKMGGYPRPLDAALEMSGGISRDEFFKKHCPPLPNNFEVQPEEPEIVEKGLFKRTFKKRARDSWSKEQWRAHRWAYCRLTEMVDEKIGRVLAALRKKGLERDTVVIFASDHGDMDSAHRLEHKTMLYDEATRVPFILSWPGVIQQGAVDSEHLVSSGLDLVPTICDFAGIEVADGLRGRTVRRLAEGKRVRQWRDHLVVESQFGRMVRTARFKYSIYQSGKNREQFIDMEKDPGEMKNLAGNEDYKEILNEHRRILRDWVESTGDTIGSKYLWMANKPDASDGK